MSAAPAVDGESPEDVDGEREPVEMLDAIDEMASPLAPSTSGAMKALGRRLVAIEAAAALAHRTNHPALKRAQTLHAKCLAAAQAYQHRNGHSDHTARDLARAFLTPGLATGLDPRTRWFLGRHYGVLATVRDRARGRLCVAVIGGRRSDGHAPAACAPVYAMPWAAAEQERFLSTLIELDPGWSFIQLSAASSRRHSRIDTEFRQRYGAVMMSEVAKQLCEAEPIAAAGKLTW